MAARQVRIFSLLAPSIHVLEAVPAKRRQLFRASL